MDVLLQDAISVFKNKDISERIIQEIESIDNFQYDPINGLSGFKKSDTKSVEFKVQDFKKEFCNQNESEQLMKKIYFKFEDIVAYEQDEIEYLEFLSGCVIEIKTIINNRKGKKETLKRKEYNKEGNQIGEYITKKIGSFSESTIVIKRIDNDYVLGEESTRDLSSGTIIDQLFYLAEFNEQFDQHSDSEYVMLDIETYNGLKEYYFSSEKSNKEKIKQYFKC